MITTELKAAIDNLIPFISDLSIPSDNPDEITFLIPPGKGPTREMCKKLFSRYTAENASDDEKDERNVLRVVFKNPALRAYFEGQRPEI